jgi:hypothetical protein
MAYPPPQPPNNMIPYGMAPLAGIPSGPVQHPQNNQLAPMYSAPPQPRRDATDPTSYTTNGFTYRLEVAQQPIRARMCGFGDKDRRPITPPPALKLVVLKNDTGEEVHPNDIDCSYFVVMVDLWHHQGTGEVNTVRHSNSSPAMSISAATTTHFPPPTERVVTLVQAVPVGHGYPNQQHIYLSGVTAAMPLPTASAGLTQGPLAALSPPGHMAVGQVAIQTGGTPYQQAYVTPNYFTGAMVPYPHPSMLYNGPQLMQLPVSPNSNTFTRNLIGSVVVNASKMKDDKDQWGIFFVFQDLSVRTEGTFRLKCSFIDIGDETDPSGINHGNPPVLATCFTDIFQVYSAKKFPGVIESTPLSKAFASQGVKIPIRKDAKPVINQEEYDRDNQDPSTGNL